MEVAVFRAVIAALSVRTAPLLGGVTLYRPACNSMLERIRETKRVQYYINPQTIAHDT
jgi:hypothetical protein